MSSRLLIDGYNLLFASGVFASAAGPPTLQRTREALLQHLADLLEPRLLGRTVVVFDAIQAPAGLPGELTFAGMQVLFSRRSQEADELLENLIAAHRAPRELLVVSSDHRVQRAARQRGAKYADSDQWLRELTRRMEIASITTKPQEVLTDSAELRRWVAEFGDVDSRRLAPEELKPVPSQSGKPASIEPAAPPNKPRRQKPRRKSPEGKQLPALPWNPFPPGYAEDMRDDEQE